MTTDGQHLWQLRRRIVSELEAASPEKRAGLKASLRGIDQLIRESSKTALAAMEAEGSLQSSNGRLLDGR
jgi:hypothetical protein